MFGDIPVHTGLSWMECGRAFRIVWARLIGEEPLCICFVQNSDEKFLSRYECSIAWFQRCALTLVCCIGWSLIAFSFLLYLQVRRSNYSVPQVKGSHYSHSVHVSRLSGRLLTQYVYFCCPLHLFLWTSMADVMSARMHYSISIWNHDVQLST